MIYPMNPQEEENLLNESFEEGYREWLGDEDEDEIEDEEW